MIPSPASNSLSSLGLAGCLLAISLLPATAARPEATGEMLYNGIVLPTTWPVRNLNPVSRAPMPVPYLASPPAVIPIDVGRQLFVDDFLIERTDLRRTWHTAQDCAANPVFVPQTPVELARSHGSEGPQEAVCYLGAGGVFFDPTENLFKMWYTAGWRGALALATSPDAVHWTRPDLGLVTDNLVLAAGEKRAGWDNGVWLDLATRDPACRLKFLTQRSARDHTLQTSADGRVWSPGVSPGGAADYGAFFYNPFRQVWVHSIKRNGPRGRERHYAEAREFMEAGVYRRSVYWTNADRLDLPDPAIGDATQLYQLHGVAYESVMLGLFSIHQGPTNRVCEDGRFPKITDLKLGFSRDGFHWDRPDRTPFIRATRREGDWNRGYLHGATGVCLVVGDWLYFPYTGFSGVSPTGWRGMYTGASIGLAVLRRDGFASMDADGTGGTLTTRPVVFSGERLFVNVDCPRGVLRVDVLDRAGAVIAPFAAERCEAISTDRTLQEIRWRDGEMLTALRGQPVRFRFHLTEGKLYSFWVSPDASGASRGYVAAGGPGFDGVTDDRGTAAYAAARAQIPTPPSTSNTP